MRRGSLWGRVFDLGLWCAKRGERNEGNGWWGTKGWERILKISRKFGEMLHWLGIERIRKEKKSDRKQ